MRPFLPHLTSLSHAVALSVALALLTTSGCGKDTTPQANTPASNTTGTNAPTPIGVMLAPLTYVNLPETVAVSGTLNADEDASVSAKQAGRVVAIMHDVGDAVPTGETLAQIDQVDYELELRERRAEKAAALAQVGLRELPDENFDAASLPAVVLAKAQASNAEAKFERAKLLFEQSPPLIAEQDFADIHTAWDVARNTVEIEVLSAEAALAEARVKAAAVATAEQRLAETVTRPPVMPDRPTLRYFVAERLVSVGEYVGVGQPMFRLVASDVIKYRVNVPERFAPRVKVGQESRVFLAGAESSDDHLGVVGRVTRVSPVVDVRSRTFAVEIEIDNSAGVFKPGTFAEGVIIVGSREHATLAPMSGVLTFAGVHRVYTISDGKASEHRVRLGARRGEQVEILDGLPSDEIITSGLSALSDGAPVRVITTQDAAGTP